MKSLILSSVIATAAGLSATQTAAADGFHRHGAFRHPHHIARHNHARHHADLAHRAFHRELLHRDAHRYPMTWRQHERLHDHLEHEAFHDHLEHRHAHRSGAYYPRGFYQMRYGSPYGFHIRSGRFSFGIGF